METRRRLRSAAATGSASNAAVLLHQEVKAETSQENLKDVKFPGHSTQKVHFVEDGHIYSCDRETGEKSGGKGGGTPPFKPDSDQEDHGVKEEKKGQSAGRSPEKEAEATSGSFQQLMSSTDYDPSFEKIKTQLMKRDQEMMQQEMAEKVQQVDSIGRKLEEQQEKHAGQQKELERFMTWQEEQAQMDAKPAEANEGKGWNSKRRHRHQNAPGKGKKHTKEATAESNDTEWRYYRGTIYQWWKNCKGEWCYTDLQDHGREPWIVSEREDSWKTELHLKIREPELYHIIRKTEKYRCLFIDRKIYLGSFTMSLQRNSTFGLHALRNQTFTSV